jgi:predicted TPR repeat methyltransferase
VRILGYDWRPSSTIRLNCASATLNLECGDLSPLCIRRDLSRRGASADTLQHIQTSPMIHACAAATSRGEYKAATSRRTPNLDHEPMQTDEVVDYFNRFAHNYDEVVLRDRDYTAFEKIPHWIVQAWAQGTCKQVLDLGCGTGLGAQRFFAQGHAVTGIDISPELVTVAGQHPYRQLLCQSLEEPLPFVDAAFDGAVLIGVMEFIKQPERLFQEIHRLLNNAGLLGVTFPHASSETATKLGIHTYAEGDVERLLASSGFRIRHSESFQGFISLGETVPYMGCLLML